MLEQQLMNACKDEPSLIFKFINKGNFGIIEKLIDENKIDVNIGYFSIIEKLIDDNKINVNLEDGVGNDVVTRLLKAKQYDLVEKLMKKRNWDVNHKNVEGNTFGHILAYDNSLKAVKVVELLNKKKNFSPNIRNNKGETSFDRAINNNYLCTAMKFLKDKRFTSFDLNSFKNLYNVVFKSSEYGKYTKKDIDLNLLNVLDKIDENMDIIKKDILNDRSTVLDNLINSYI